VRRGKAAPDFRASSRPTSARADDGPARPPPAPLRLRPNLFSAHTQPGFESIAIEEIVARVPGAREVARRGLPDKAGITIFSAPRADVLTRLRTAEDIFAIGGYRAGLGIEPSALDKLRGAAREAPWVAAAAAERAHTIPGARAGRRLKYRVVARLVGAHHFRRVDMQRAVERGIAEREDHTWRLAEDSADVEFWATMLDGEFILEVRLSDERMRHREYKIAHRAGSLRPSVAAALAWLSEPNESDVVLDPFCGAATILIERAHLGRYVMLYGSDHDQAALEAARANVGPRYKPIKLERWNAAKLPLKDASVTKIVTNLPWGQRVGSHGANRRLYPLWFREFHRVLKTGGLVVALSAEGRIMRELDERREFRPSKTFRVSILGAPAAIYVGRRN